MIGSFSVVRCHIRASGLNRPIIIPETNECFLTLTNIQEVTSDVYLPVE